MCYLFNLYLAATSLSPVVVAAHAIFVLKLLPIDRLQGSAPTSRFQDLLGRLAGTMCRPCQLLPVRQVSGMSINVGLFSRVDSAAEHLKAPIGFAIAQRTSFARAAHVLNPTLGPKSVYVSMMAVQRFRAHHAWFPT